MKKLFIAIGLLCICLCCINTGRACIDRINERNSSSEKGIIRRTTLLTGDRQLQFYGYISEDNAIKLGLNSSGEAEVTEAQLAPLRFTDCHVAAKGDTVYAKGRLYNNGSLTDCKVEARWKNEKTYTESDKYKGNRVFPIIPLTASMSSDGCASINTKEVKEGQGRRLYELVSPSVPAEKLNDFVLLCNKLSDESPHYSFELTGKYIADKYVTAELGAYCKQHSLYNIASFESKLKKQEKPVRGSNIVYSDTDLWEGIDTTYNAGSADWTSYDFPEISTEEDLLEALDRLEYVVTEVKANNPGIISEKSFENILNYISDCSDDPTVPLTQKFNLNQTFRSIYAYLGAYKNYEYDLADLCKRQALKKSHTVFRTHILDLEGKGIAAPIHSANDYDQYVAYYGTESAYFLGQQYQSMTGIAYSLYGISQTVNVTGNAIRSIIQQRGALRLAISKIIC